MNFLRRAIIVILIFIPFAGFTQEETAQEEGGAETASELNIDELRRRITGEARQELMNISLFMAGSWKGDLQGNSGFSFSQLGFDFTSPETPLLYKQFNHVALD